jgi:hypothetical protein
VGKASWAAILPDGRNNEQCEMVRGNPERSARRTCSIGGNHRLARPPEFVDWPWEQQRFRDPAPSRHLNELVRINGGCPAAIDALPGMIAEKMRRVTQRRAR